MEKKNVKILKRIALVSLLAASAAGTVFAASPIPTFDKEAVTLHPYMRTGGQDITGTESYRPGNTGTEDAPAFYVKKIKLTGYPVIYHYGELQEILDRYSGKSLDAPALDSLCADVTRYCKDRGLTIVETVIPRQEVEDGVLCVEIHAASFDKVEITQNTTKVYTPILEKYAKYLKPGDTIKDRPFEAVMNRMNDLPGVTARAVLSPGSASGTTAVSIEALRRPIWNNYIFADNGGGYYSGRYRYGFHTEINNPGHNGDKIIVTGMMSNKDMKSGSVRYEGPAGYKGTRLGIAWSRSDYEIHQKPLDTIGEAKGISLYGFTPIWRDKQNRVTAIYGYDHRDIENEWRLPINGKKLGIQREKDANVYHIGISGSQYYPNEFTQYSLIYWYGHISTAGGAYYDGDYHKLTADLLKIWYDGRWNYRVNFSGQLGNRALDGSEQFFLGGMNGVRAYGSGEGYGDYGFLSSGEIRWRTNNKDLELAAFIDHGVAGDKARDRMAHLTGWGLGLRYEKQNDWYCRLDWARKINAKRDTAEPRDHDGRIWFQVYKMF